MARKKKIPSNNSGAVKTCSARLYWKAYENLVPELRKFLQECVFNFHPKALLKYQKAGYAAQNIISHFKNLEKDHCLKTGSQMLHHKVEPLYR